MASSDVYLYSVLFWVEFCAVILVVVIGFILSLVPFYKAAAVAGIFEVFPVCIKILVEFHNWMGIVGDPHVDFLRIRLALVDVRAHVQNVIHVESRSAEEDIKVDSADQQDEIHDTSEILLFHEATEY